MSEWQPIDTAPRDGTRVLLTIQYGVRQRLEIGYWGRGLSRETGSWRFHRVHNDDRPTHWMPLPAPPEPAS